MSENIGYIYITTDKIRGTLYIGVTSDLVKRIWEHKSWIHPESFTSQCNCKKLVYYEAFWDILTAIEREKQLKNWHRDWKLNLIESKNPYWNDSYNEILL